MQCSRRVWRPACTAHNAYNPSRALQAAFSSTAKRRDGQAPRSPQSAATPAKDFTVKPESRPHRIIRYTGRPKETVSNGEQDANERHDRWKPRMQRIGRALEHISRARKSGRGLDRDRMKPYDAAVFDYRPSVIWMPSIKSDEASSIVPWQFGFASGPAEPASLLGREIARFAEWVKPTPIEALARQAVAEEVMDVIRRAKVGGEPALGIELHGSEKTGLAVAWSDIDIRVWSPQDSPSFKHVERVRLWKRLTNVSEFMAKTNRFFMASVRGGSYPILNVQHKPSGLDIQIVASHSSHPQEQVTAKYLAEIPNLRALFWTIRTAFDIRGLNDVFHGGLGSYGTLILLVAILKRQHRDSTLKTDPKLRNRVALIENQLQHFLGTFSGIGADVIDIEKYGLACFPRPTFLKHDPSPTLTKFSALALQRKDPVRAGQWRLSERSEYMPYLLCLQDPANPTNDLGRRTWAIKHITATLAQCDRDLCKIFDHFDTKRKRWRQWEGRGLSPSLLTVVVGRPDLVFRERRAKLEGYGLDCLKRRQEMEMELEAARAQWERDAGEQRRATT